MLMAEVSNALTKYAGEGDSCRWRAGIADVQTSTLQEEPQGRKIKLATSTCSQTLSWLTVITEAVGFPCNKVFFEAKHVLLWGRQAISANGQKAIQCSLAFHTKIIPFFKEILLRAISTAVAVEASCDMWVDELIPWHRLQCIKDCTLTAQQILLVIAVVHKTQSRRREAQNPTNKPHLGHLTRLQRVVWCRTGMDCIGLLPEQNPGVGWPPLCRSRGESREFCYDSLVKGCVLLFWILLIAVVFVDSNKLRQ